MHHIRYWQCVTVGQFSLLTAGYVKHMYSNILCVQRHILHTPSLLSGCTARRHSFTTLLLLPFAMLNMRRWLSDPPPPPPPTFKELRVQEREENQQTFFQQMKEIFGIPRATLCCRAVCYQMAARQDSLAADLTLTSQKFQKHIRTVHLNLGAVFPLEVSWPLGAVLSLFSDLLIMAFKTVSDAVHQEFSHLHVWYVSLF